MNKLLSLDMLKSLVIFLALMPSAYGKQSTVSINHESFTHVEKLRSVHKKAFIASFQPSQTDTTKRTGFSSASQFATATDLIVSYDGSDWIRKGGTYVANGGTIIAGPSSTVYYQRLFDGGVQARWFGVSANKTDNTASIQAAINYTQANNAHDIYFPSGRIQVNSTLYITARDIHFYGLAKGRYVSTSSQFATELYFKGNGSFIELGNDDGTPLDSNAYNGIAAGFTARNIGFSTNSSIRSAPMAGGQGNYAPGTIGIRDWRGGDITMEHVTIEGFEYSFWGVQSDINNFKDVIQLYSRYGFYLGPRSDQNTMDGLYSLFCDSGLTLDRPTGLRVMNGQFVACGSPSTPAIELYKGTSSCSFLNNWYESFQTGTNTKLAVFRIGEKNGYNGITTTPKGIYIKNSIVMCGKPGETEHINTFANITYGVNIDIDGIDAAQGIGVGTDTIVINKAGIDYNITNWQVRVRNVQLPASRLYRNNAVVSGDILLEIPGAPTGGIAFSSNRPRLELQNITSTAAGLDRFAIYNDGTAGKFVFQTPTYTAGPATRFTTERSIQFATAAPTSGTAQQGDLYFNKLASYLQPTGWIATSSGSPGTWRPFGYIGSKYDSSKVAITGGTIIGNVTISSTQNFSANNGDFSGAYLAVGGANVAGKTYYRRGTDGVNTAMVGFSSNTTSTDFQVANTGGGGVIGFNLGGGTRFAQFMGTTGNLLLQNGGIYTDNGQDRIQVSGSILSKFASGSGSPSTSRIPNGYMLMWKDTATGDVKWYVNDGGTVKTASVSIPSSNARMSALESLWQRKGQFVQNTQGEAVIIGSGITKTPAGYSLYVADGVLTERVKVAVKSTADWSDKVFSPSYKLQSLSKVEQYINQHQHLPGIPAAAEMVRQGNDLHQTDVKLLEKIEELTLYSIQLEKADQAKQRRLDEQQNRLEELEKLVKQLLKKQ